MIPPLASSRPDTGRNRTETSMSPNFLSSSTATAQGCVSTVCARTLRSPDGRRTHWPATNFHFEFSAPRSYFIVVVSPDATATVVTTAAANNMTTRFMSVSSFSSFSVQALRHNLPLIAAYKGHLGHGTATRQVRERSHGAVPGVAIDGCGRCLRERACRLRHRRLLGLRGREISSVGDGLDFRDRPSPVIDDDLHERISGVRIGLDRVHRELDGTIADLVLGGEWCPLSGTDDQPALERKRGAL